MNRSFFTFLLLIAAIPIATVVFAEQSADVVLGKVKMRNLAKLDNKSRGEVTALATRIKKQRTSGVIKIRGDFPGAESAQEYLSKSVLMAREVERYLSTLLPAKFQVFVTASVYSGAKRAGESFVEILMYPHQLQLQELESLRFVSTQAKSLQEEPVEIIQPIESIEPVKQVDDAGLLSPSIEKTGINDAASNRERDKRDSENAAIANELVNKAKARAAEKAKRDAAEN